MWMDLGAIGCLGVLLIPTYALERDIRNVRAYTLTQCAKENIVLLEKIVNAKALLLLVSIVYNVQLVRCERQFFV